MFKITKNWYELLKDEFEKPYFKKLQEFLTEEYNTKTIYPLAENIFNALNYCKYEDISVVLIGQDPYHQPGQAHGLCFSVQDETALPPSLKNIFKEIHDDLGVTPLSSGNLIRWAKQGVLLLNTVLTVRRDEPNSHKGKGWENFTTKVIELVNKKTSPVVFLLWGGNAKAFEGLIDKNKHYVLKAAHPSPLSAYNGFFGCKHFSKTNEILEKNGKKPIDWR